MQDASRKPPNALSTLAITVVVLSTCLQLFIIIAALLPNPASGSGSWPGFGTVILIGLMILFVPAAALVSLVLAVVYSVRQRENGGVGLAVAFFWFATLLPIVTLSLVHYGAQPRSATPGLIEQFYISIDAIPGRPPAQPAPPGTKAAPQR